MKKLTAIVLLWLACGIAGAGGLCADAMYRFGPCSASPTDTYRESLPIAAALSLFGPVTLVVSFATTHIWEHGWSLAPPVCKPEAWRGRQTQIAIDNALKYVPRGAEQGGTGW